MLVLETMIVCLLAVALPRARAFEESNDFREVVIKGRFPRATVGRVLPAGYNEGSLCATNTECAALGLDGACCPTKTGKYLDCCDKGNSDDDSLCASNTKCAALGLDGACCPTKTGKYLDCCDHADRNDNSLCSAHSVCADLGLDGACCPTKTGQYLDCCNAVPSKGKGKGYSKGKGGEYSGGKRSYSKGKGSGYSKGKGKRSVNASPSPSPTPVSKGKGGTGSKGMYSNGKGIGMMNSKGHEYSKGGKGPAPKGSECESHSCACTGVFQIAQHWQEPILEANGTVVEASKASNVRGQKWSYVNDLMSADGSRRVGFSAELRTRLNDGDKWQGEGTIMDLNGCSGYISFMGSFSDFTLSGFYTITGGTGDFSGAKGYISETFQYVNLQGTRKVVIE